MRQRRIKNLEEKLEDLSAYAVEDAEEMRGNWRSLFPALTESGEADDHAATDAESGGEADDHAATDAESGGEADREASGRLFAEFGCGKGKFIQDMASAHPENGYIAFEGNQSVVYHAMQKADERKLCNVKFITHYIDTAAEYFADGELDGIYLNFSDPWPKSKHEKRRLTQGRRLEDYIHAVRKGGTIEFRTDNDDLFEYTMDEMMMQSGIKIVAVTRDLHSEIEEVAYRIDLTELTDAGFEEGVDEGLTTLEDLGITSEYEDRFSERGKTINYVRVKVV